MKKYSTIIIILIIASMSLIFTNNKIKTEKTGVYNDELFIYTANKKSWCDSDAMSLFHNDRNVEKSLYFDFLTEKDEWKFANQTEEIVTLSGNGIQYYNLKGLKDIWRILPQIQSKHVYFGSGWKDVPSLPGLTIQEAVHEIKKTLENIDENSYDTPSLVVYGGTQVIDDTIEAIRKERDFDDVDCPEFYYIEMPLMIENIPCSQHRRTSEDEEAPGITAIVTSDGVVELVVYCSYENFKTEGEGVSPIEIKNAIKKHKDELPDSSRISSISLYYISRVAAEGDINFTPIWVWMDDQQWPLYICDAFSGEKIWKLELPE